MKFNEHLNWEVKELPVFIGYPNTNIETRMDMLETKNKALVNDSTKDLLSIVSQNYAPCKNKEFEKIVEKISSITGFENDGYVSFKNGIRVLGYLKNANDIKVADDRIKHHLVIGNHFDGKHSFFVGTSMYVYRCENMFSSVQKLTNIRHSSLFDERVSQFYNYLKRQFESDTENIEILNKFAETKLDQATRDHLVKYLFNLKQEDRLDKISTRKKNKMILLNGCIDNEIKDVGNTLWGLFNGVTYYTSHKINSKNAIYGNLFGTEYLLNARAFDYMKKKVLL